MNKLELDDFQYKNISISISDTENGVQVKFNGDLDIEDPETVFMPYFNSINEKVIEKNIKEVELNFSDLQFLNSSGIKVLIKWIQIDLMLPEEKKYKFKILANSKIPWQENSLKLLSMLSPKIIQIQII